MPVNHTRLNLHDVMAILRRRGFAFHSQHGVGLRLTTPDRRKGVKSFASGRAPRNLLIPISARHLDEVLLMSRNDEEAAAVIERMSLGHMPEPQFHQPAAAPALDSQQLDQMVTARVENAMARQAQQHQARVSSVQAELDKALEELEALKKQSVKPARKKRASKKRGKAAASAPAEADLDPDEEKALNDVLAGEAAELAQLEDE